MRAINIFIFLSAILLQGCTTIEVAKEVTKATKSVKTSIDNIISKDESDKEFRIMFLSDGEEIIRFWSGRLPWTEILDGSCPNN